MIVGVDAERVPGPYEQRATDGFAGLSRPIK
jgi:hypothetical protein